MPRGRRKQDDISEKQLEVYQLMLKFVQKYGYQPNSSDLCELLQIARPAVRNRLEYLVEKNFLQAPPAGSERRFGFVGVKFLAYQVDPSTEEITSEQEYDLGDYVVTFKKKVGA